MLGRYSGPILDGLARQAQLAGHHSRTASGFNCSLSRVLVCHTLQIISSGLPWQEILAHRARQTCLVPNLCKGQASPMRLAMLIKERRRHLRLSQAALGKLVGVSRAAIGQWEDGATAPTRRNAPKLARALQLDIGAIYPLLAQPLAHVDIASQAGTIPFMPWEDFARGEDSTTATDRISVGIDVPSDAVALRAPDNAMAPDVPQGAVVIVSPGMKPQTNDLAVVLLGKTSVLRTYVDRGRDSQGRQVFDLLSTGADWSTITCNSSNPGNVLGVVVAVTKPMVRR